MFGEREMWGGDVGNALLSSTQSKYWRLRHRGKGDLYHKNPCEKKDKGLARKGEILTLLTGECISRWQERKESFTQDVGFAMGELPDHYHNYITGYTNTS